MKALVLNFKKKYLTEENILRFANNLFFFLAVTAFFVSRTAAAAPGGDGVEDLLVNASDYLSGRLIPAASGLGILSGGAMAGLGNPKGWEVIKWSIGGAVTSAGVNTLQHVFFQ